MTVYPADVGPATVRVARSFRGVLGELGITVRADVDPNPIHVVRAILGRMGLGVRVKKSSGNGLYVVSKGDTAKMEVASARYLGRILDRDPTGKLLRNPVLAEMEVELDVESAIPLLPEAAAEIEAELFAAYV